MQAEDRFETASCPHCQTRQELGKRSVLAHVSTAAEARAILVQPVAMTESLPRHDSLVDAAASKAKGIRSKTRLAETALEWGCKLFRPLPHGQAIEILQAAGLDAERGEQEIRRLLVQDQIFEPKVGHYSWLS